MARGQKDFIHRSDTLVVLHHYSKSSNWSVRLQQVKHQLDCSYLAYARCWCQIVCDWQAAHDYTVHSRQLKLLLLVSCQTVHTIACGRQQFAYFRQLRFGQPKKHTMIELFQFERPSKKRDAVAVGSHFESVWHNRWYMQIDGRNVCRKGRGRQQNVWKRILNSKDADAYVKIGDNDELSKP